MIIITENKKSLPEARDTRIKAGDKVTFDSNARGVYPSRGKGIVQAVRGGMATRGFPAYATLDIKCDNGKVITLDSFCIETVNGIVYNGS